MYIVPSSLQFRADKIIYHISFLVLHDLYILFAQRPQYRRNRSDSNSKQGFKALQLS